MYDYTIDGVLYTVLDSFYGEFGVEFRLIHSHKGFEIKTFDDAFIKDDVIIETLYRSKNFIKIKSIFEDLYIDEMEKMARW